MVCEIFGMLISQQLYSSHPSKSYSPELLFLTNECVPEMKYRNDLVFGNGSEKAKERLTVAENEAPVLRSEVAVVKQDSARHIQSLEMRRNELKKRVNKLKGVELSNIKPLEKSDKVRIRTLEMAPQSYMYISLRSSKAWLPTHRLRRLLNH